LWVVKVIHLQSMSSAPTTEVFYGPHIPSGTVKEQEHYSGPFSLNAHFSTTQEEYIWSNQQYRKCTKCSQIKNLNYFNGNTSGKDPFDKNGFRLKRPECSECTKKVGQGKMESLKIAKTLGIDHKAPPGTVCANCKELPKQGNGLVFDHDHKALTFRGYACNSCNRSMGALGDDVKGLLQALNYLNKSEKLTIVQNSDGELVIVE
jgi:hypothetical protein